MKDSQSLPKKNKSKKTLPKTHIFDFAIILLLLDIASVALVVFYIHKINSYSIPKSSNQYLKITQIPLSSDLNSINASAEAYVVYDPSTRSVVAGKNQNLRFSPASTAKVMTAVLAIEYYNLDQYLTVPDDIYSVQGSKMNLVPGEELTVRDLLYGMLLPSGNDAAYTLAYNYPGGIEGFVAKMNKRARDLGLSNTYFADPAGFEDGNYTTGAELARLGAFAMQKDFFREVVKTRTIDVNNRAFNHKFHLVNLNELLQFDNVLGIKTGFTNEAGGVLLTAIAKNGKLLIVAVLKSQDRFSDTKDIMNFIQEKVDFSYPEN